MGYKLQLLLFINQSKTVVRKKTFLCPNTVTYIRVLFYSVKN